MEVTILEISTSPNVYGEHQHMKYLLSKKESETQFPGLKDMPLEIDDINYPQLKGEGHPNWKGGISLDKKKYMKGYNKEYNQKPETISKRKEYDKARPERKAYNKEYDKERAKTPERKAYVKAYNQSPERKEYMKEYNQRPEVIAKKKLYYENHREK